MGRKTLQQRKQDHKQPLSCEELRDVYVGETASRVKQGCRGNPRWRNAPSCAAVGQGAAAEDAKHGRAHQGALVRAHAKFGQQAVLN